MSYLVWLVPIALGMGVAGLGAFLWSMRSGQYDDLDGAAERVLIIEGADAPLRQKAWAEDQLRLVVHERERAVRQRRSIGKRTERIRT